MAEEVTKLLAALSKGHNVAVDELMSIVYGELRKLASGLLNGERPGPKPNCGSRYAGLRSAFRREQGQAAGT